MKELHKILHIGRLVALVTLMLVSAQGHALAADAPAWKLQESAGDVRLVKSGISPIALTAGDVFGGGDWIETGPSGRAVLVRGEERIVVAPNSRIGLPTENTGPFTTRILQTLGTILLTVEKKANQHFEVETPYLAAVVKGTTFTVGIQGKRAVVHVVEGLVEVRDLASGQRNMVRPGQTGAVLSGSGSGVSVQGGNRGADSAPALPSETAGPSVNHAASGSRAQSTLNGAVVIREALGPVKVDLSNTTGGLMREVKPATKSTNPGEAAVNADVRGNSVAARVEHGQVAKIGKASVSRGGLGAGRAPVDANGLAFGKSATASGLPKPRRSVAAAGTPPGQAAGRSGLSNGVGAAGTPPGQSVSPAQTAVTASVHQANVSRPLDNPGRGNGGGNRNGNGNGNGKVKGN